MVQRQKDVIYRPVYKDQMLLFSFQDLPNVTSLPGGHEILPRNLGSAKRLSLP